MKMFYISKVLGVDVWEALRYLQTFVFFSKQPRMQIIYVSLNPRSLRASQVVLVVKNLPVNAVDIWDMGSIPVLGRSPGGGHGNSFQYSCLEHPHGQRSLEGYSPWGHKSSDTTERISTYILVGNSESLLWLSLNQSWKFSFLPSSDYTYWSQGSVSIQWLPNIFMFGS